MTKTQKVIGITAGVFFAEAMIHYNIGVNKDKDKFKLEFPKNKELLRIVSVVLIASYVSRKLAEKYA
jgi:hypothetical protein